jgi:hypothetical protein
MRQADFDTFARILGGCLGLWNRVPSPEVSAFWFRALEGYDLATVSAAFSAHVRDPENGKFEPKPAHVIAQIERAVKNDGRPGAEEAWSVAVASQPEAETVVWTDETRQAWFDAALPLIRVRDQIGARMAFKEAYARLVTEARANQTPVVWIVSDGTDPERKRAAVARAVESGRIPASELQALPMTGGPLLLGSEAGKPSDMPPETREKLRELRELFKGPKPQRVSPADAERDRLQELKRAQQQKVDQLLNGQPGTPEPPCT